MKDFRELKVWQEAHQLTLRIYQMSYAFPKEELYGLTSQIRRSSSSIPANLSEGCGRSSDADFARYVSIAFSSACETEYHLLLAKDLKILNPDDYHQTQKALTSIKRMLSALLKKLKADC